jgi:hypothetical protein
MLLVGTFPWSVFAVPVVLDTDRWMSAKRRDGSLLLLCWVGLATRIVQPGADETAELHHAVLSCGCLAAGG